MILTKLEREKQTSFGKTSSYNIISMIILNTNYETIMSLCRKVQNVLQINSQSRQNLIFFKKSTKTFIMSTYTVSTTDVTPTRCLVNELAEVSRRSGDTVKCHSLTVTLALGFDPATTLLLLLLPILCRAAFYCRIITHWRSGQEELVRS